MRQNTIFCLFMLLISLMCVVSCSGENKGSSDTSGLTSESDNEVTHHETISHEPHERYDYHEPHDYIVGRFTGCMWGETLFYAGMTDSGIWYQDVNNIQDTKLPLYNDPLMNDSDNPFSRLQSPYLLVDEHATVENDNFPVLMIAGNCFAGEVPDGEGFALTNTVIGSFDTLTNRWTVLTDDIKGELLQFVMYKDMIFVVTFDWEEGGYIIHGIKRDGSGHIKMDTPEKTQVEIGWIHNNLIYYKDSGDLCTYSCKTDFSDRKKIFDKPIDIEYVTDEHIYYSVEGAKAHDLYRCGLNDISNGELLIESATGEFYDDVFFYSTSMNVLCSYDINTGKKETLYDLLDDIDKVVKGVYAYGDPFLICFVIDLEDDYDNIQLACLDLESGEEWTILKGLK